ncbi:hypothetical protein HPB48_011190 [Haemaphysalis longicornis]|uniref:PiggyBac transposable element-derived protein domain-containing protein n=1 Tax=Haemaphysalis longicornis TaxID=44386 RepID=A0A9J6GYI5_HAELO|nr:hypothetical protein HPB48_011190 [Haemaphysalis longicornis]
MQENTAIAIHQKTEKILNSSCSEMQNFLGATLMMSCLGYPQMRLYWARGTRVPAIADVLTRDRFFSLRGALEVVNDLDFPKKTKRAVVCGTLDNFKPGAGSMQKAPEAFFSVHCRTINPIDRSHYAKSVWVWKASPCRAQEFSACKPHPSGLVLDFDIYQRKSFLKVDNCPDLGLGPNIVQLFARTLPMGISLFFDRYFTTLPLIEKLGKMSLRGTGTIMKNRVSKH